MRTTVTLSILCTLVLACSSHGHDEESPGAEACEHLEGGPAVAVTAAGVSSAAAPRIDSDHRRYDIRLADVAGGKGGFVTLEARVAGEHVFFTSGPVQLEVKTSGGVTVPGGAVAASIPECTIVKGRQSFELMVGTHVIEVRSGTAAEVSVVVEAHAH